MPQPSEISKTPGVRFDLPVVEDETAPFWDACRAGRFVIKRCGACGKWHYYPREHCPHCWSEDVEWAEPSGRGTVYTYSVIHRNDLPPFPGMVPYVAAIVDLDEGPRMMTRMVGVDPLGDDMAIGMAVTVDFEALTDEITIPVFRPT